MVCKALINNDRPKFQMLLIPNFTQTAGF